MHAVYTHVDVGGDLGDGSLLGVAVFIFRPHWLDLAEIALLLSLSTAMMFFLLKVADNEEKQWLLKEKRKYASDQV